MNYTEYKLPQGAEIFEQIKNLRNCNSSELKDIINYLTKEVLNIVKVFDTFVDDIEYQEDPDLNKDRLQKYHYVVSGLWSLAKAVEQRAFYFPYKAMEGETNDKGKSISAADKKIYVDGEVADIIGFVKGLELLEKNISSRIYSLKR